MQKWLAVIFLSLMSLLSSAVEPSTDALIAYLRLTDGYWQVWVTDADGNQHRQLTSDSIDKARVSWNPEHTKLLCNANDGSLRIIEVNPLTSSKLTFDSLGVFDAQWSPTGKQITYSATTSLQADNAEIWISDIDGQSKRKITDSLSVALTPAWNPQNNSVLYSAGKPGKNQELWEVNPNTGKSEQLTVSHSSALDPSVNAQGVIVYSSDVSGRFNLWLMDAARKVEQLTHSAAFDAQPSWSPDGSRIVFYRLEGNTRRLWVMDVKTRQARPITSAEVASRYPAWIR